METSQLKAIIDRLERMTDENSGVEIRSFEKDGEQRCSVRYNRDNDTFELKDPSVDETFQFDDIDLVAMEIYDLIQ